MVGERGPPRVFTRATIVRPVPTFFGNLVRRIGIYISGRDILKGTILASPASIWFLAFLILPMVIIVFVGFADYNADLTLSYSNLSSNNYLRALDPFGRVAALTARTLMVSVLATAGALAIGFPVAYYLARVASESKRGLLVSLVVIPFWISFVVQVYAILPWVQQNGYVIMFFDAIRLGSAGEWIIDNFGRGTANIVPLSLMWLWVTFMILPLFTALLRIERELLEAAHDLGAGKWATFWNVTVPLSFPGIVTGSILVFITSFGSFVEPQILAGQSGRLVGNFIYDNFLRIGNMPMGAAASIVVIAVTILVLYLYSGFAEEARMGLGEENRVSAALNKIRERLKGIFPKRTEIVGMPNGMAFPARPRKGPLETLFDRVGERYGSILLAAFTAIVIGSFYVPLVQVVAFSFNHDNNIVNWSHFSLRWYLPGQTTGVEEVRALFGDEEMMRALMNSFFIGFVVTGISLLVGTPAALAFVRYTFWFKKPLNLMLYTGLVMPSIVMGASLLVFITLVNDLYLAPYFRTWWNTGYESIIVGHVTFCIPIVIIVLLISLREFDRSLEEAAMNLGANEVTTFFKVTLPIIKPGIVSAALLSFTFSFDELIVTVFLKGQGIETLPVVMWSTLTRKIPTPELNAAATLIIALSIVFVILANKVQKGGTLFRF